MKLSLHPIAHAAGAALLLAFASGCGAAAGAPSKPAVVFPSRAELAAIPSKPVSAAAFEADSVRVDRWEFQSPPARADEPPYDDASPWGGVAREVAARHKGAARLSGGLRCAAEEMARFYLERGALPTESLRRFMIARCGASFPEAAHSVVTVDAAAQMTEEALAHGAEPLVQKGLDKLIHARHVAIGVGAARKGDRAAVVSLIAADDLQLEAGSRQADAKGLVVVRGSIRGEAAAISGTMNKGDFDVASCESDKRVAPPKFALRCRVTDASTWLQIVVRRQGRLLTSSVGDVLLYGPGDGAIEYRTRTSGAPAEIATVAEFTPALLDRLNRVRRAAHRDPVTLAARQSAENARVAGTLIEASLAESDAADKVAIGLLAGWDVEGLIQKGDFFLGMTAATRDATTWLDVALERPMGRSVLLARDARSIAVGPAIPAGTPALGAVVTTYSLFETNDHTPEADRIAARLESLRAERGVEAPIRVVASTLHDQANLVLTRDKPPSIALNDAMESISRKTGSAVAGYILEASDIEDFKLPEELLGPGHLQVAIEVTHHRAPGAAWGQYVVLIAATGVSGGAGGSI
jgi:hypothetical protein